MVRAFISLGSNISPARNMRGALRLLGQRQDLAAISTVYRAKAEGRPEQADYLNCVAEVHTEQPPSQLRYRVLGPIEDALGRLRTADKFAPRTIDLDLIAYDDLVIRNPQMELPDSQIFRRAFLAAGLAELAPQWIIPGSGKTASEAAATLGVGGMIALTRYTTLLRKTLLRPTALLAGQGPLGAPEASSSPSGVCRG